MVIAEKETTVTIFESYYSNLHFHVDTSKPIYRERPLGSKIALGVYSTKGLMIPSNWETSIGPLHKRYNGIAIFDLGIGGSIKKTTLD